MRILFLSHRHTDLTLGGLAEFLTLLPRYLISHNIESYIYTQDADKHCRDLRGPTELSNHAKLYTGPFIKPRWWHGQRNLKALLELCIKEKIDCIHAQGTYRAGFMARAIYRQIKLPYVVTSHSDILTTNSSRLARRSIVRRCQSILKDASFVTHLTPPMAEASHAIFNTKNKSAIVHNGIDISTYQSEANTTTPYFLAIGRLVPEKGFLVLLDAFLQLQQQGSEASLVIAGEGILENTLIEKARAAGIHVVVGCKSISDIPKRSIVFTQYVRADLKAQLFAATICVLFAPQPAVWDEAFGIVQLEAMAASKPLIVSDIGITRYLQQLGMSAELIDAADSFAWARAMQRLIANPLQRHAMGRQNAASVKAFDWSKIAAEYAAIYQRVAAHNS